MEDKAIVKGLIVLFKPYWKSITFIVLFLIISTILNLLIPLTSKRIMDEGFLKNNFRIVTLYSIITCIIVIIDKLLNVLKEMIRANIDAELTFSLYEKAYKHIMKLRIQYFSTRNYAEILNDVSVDIGNVSRIADSSLFFVITQVFSMIGGIIGLLLISWKLTIIVLSFIPAKYIVVTHFINRRKALEVDFIESNSDFAQWFGDTVGGIKEVRNFGILKHKQNEFRKKQQNIIKIKRNMEVLGSWNGASELILIQLLSMFLYIGGANMLLNMKLTVGSIFAFVTYSTYVTTPISAILNIGYMLSGIIPSAKRFYDFLNLEVEENSEVLDEEFKSEKTILKGNISFDKVSFSYEDGQTVLKDASFDISAGEKVALIGMNGAGKSTIIDLILRFYKADKGIILLDGKDIQTYDINQYRENMSVVSQYVYLFDTTLIDNITLYTNVNESSINQAIEDSQLSELVSTTRKDIKVGQNGMMLSGGQRQKIAMARALIRNNEILIFDEATSNLDIESELNINKLLETRLKDKTVIFVTHKIETLKHVDKILLLQKGKVISIDAHKFLFGSNDLYKNIESIFNKKNA